MNLKTTLNQNEKFQVAHSDKKKKKYSTYMNNFFDYIKGKAWAYE